MGLFSDDGSDSSSEYNLSWREQRLEVYDKRTGQVETATLVLKILGVLAAAVPLLLMIGTAGTFSGPGYGYGSGSGSESYFGAATAPILLIFSAIAGASFWIPALALNLLHDINGNTLELID
jgi:hypothetical protein